MNVICKAVCATATISLLALPAAGWGQQPPAMPVPTSSLDQPGGAGGGNAGSSSVGTLTIVGIGLGAVALAGLVAGIIGTTFAGPSTTSTTSTSTATSTSTSSSTGSGN